MGVAVDSSDDGFADVGDGGGPGCDEVGVGDVGEGEVFHLLDVGAGWGDWMLVQLRYKALKDRREMEG